MAPRPSQTQAIEPTPMSQTLQVTIAAAEIAKEHGDYEVALEMFKEVLGQNPVATEAFVGIGGIHLIKKEWDQAEPVFAHAARLDPRNFQAQYGHAVSLQMLKRFIDAVRAYHRALTIDPEDVSANANIAATYLQLGRPKSALAFAEHAAELDGASVQAQITLAATYQLLDRPQDALNAYISASEAMDEPSPQLIRNIIQLLREEKRYREVVNTTSQLVQIDPTTNSYEQLGWAEFRLGDYVASLAAYRTAVEYDKRNWRALNGIGVNELNRWLLSDRQESDAYHNARSVFRQSLELNANQPKVITLILRYGL